MIEYSFDKTNAILHLQPRSSLEQADFEKLAEEIDPFIADTGDLTGLIIETPAFPGWSSFSAFITHLRFVKDHRRHIKKIALVTDSVLGDLAEHLMAHFVSAEIRQFPAAALSTAKEWICPHS